MTILAADIPEEPPPGSVVVDRRGAAWQSSHADIAPPVGRRWQSVGGDLGTMGPVSWALLLAELGPVSLVYIPGGDP